MLESPNRFGRLLSSGMQRRVSVESPMTFFILVLYLAYISTLKMEAEFSSETSVYFERNARFHIPEDTNLHHIYIFVFKDPVALMYLLVYIYT
jgi:hypothetical protein